MTIRKTVSVLLALGAAGASAPVLADCCSSFWDCAATVVTEGVSCEVETIIDTIKALVTEVTNFGNDVTGITNYKQQAARAYVANTISNMQLQSQQGDADLAGALSQAQVFYKEETAILTSKSQIMVNPALPANGPTTTVGPPRPQANQNASRSVTGALPAALTSLHGQGVVPAGGTASNAPPTGTFAASTAAAPTAEPIQAPHGTYADAFSRAVTLLTALKSSGDADLSKVNQYLSQAQSSEGAGVTAAATIAGALQSPVTAIESQLASMLANPLDAFDPSSIVDDMEKSLTTEMSANIPLMINDITTGPDQQFAAAQPTYDELLGNAQSAMQLLGAMSNLYRLRTTAAANALYAILPKISYANLTSKATASRSVAANFGQRQSYAVISANNAAAKQKLLVISMPASLAQIHTLVAKFKTQRVQGKSPLAQALMVNYQSNLSTQLNSYFSGKSAAAVASERDQLIAQARTKYAGDPATTNGVIALLTSEAAKRGAGTNAALAITPVPGQPVPGLKTPAPTWGATPAPAWHAPVAGAAAAATPATSSTFKATTALKAAQPLQQPAQSTLQTAPSSLGR